MPKQKKKKPYKSLTDVYLKESFGLNVPLLPRQTVLNEAKGMADVVIQKDHPEGGVAEYQVPNAVADRLLSIIKRSVQQDIEGEKMSVDDVIAKCLEIDRWAPEGQGRKSAVFREVVNAFENVELNHEQFNNLLAIQKDKNNLVRNVLLRDSNVHKLDQLVPEGFKKLFINPNDSLKVLQSLWRIFPESEANVGPGEVALTLISDAVKGVEGDLDFSDIGLAELKGNNAALGSGKIAVDQTYEELNKILQTKSGSTIQTTYIEAQRQTIIRKVNELISKYKGYIARPSKTDTRDDINLRKSILAKLISLLPKLEAAKDANELINDVKASGLPAVKKTKKRTGETVEVPGEQAELLKEIEKFSGIVKGEITSIRGGKKSKFGPAVSAFFASPNLSVEDRIEGTKFLRSSPRTNQNLIAEVAKELLAKYPRLLTFESGVSGGNTQSDLNKFIGAIHVAEYQQEKKFKYIIFFNSDQEDKSTLPSKIVSLGFAGTGDTFKEDVIKVFEFFKRPDVNASIKLGVDETRGTVRVAIT